MFFIHISPQCLHPDFHQDRFSGTLVFTEFSHESKPKPVSKFPSSRVRCVCGPRPQPPLGQCLPVSVESLTESSVARAFSRLLGLLQVLPSLVSFCICSHDDASAPDTSALTRRNRIKAKSNASVGLLKASVLTSVSKLPSGRLCLKVPSPFGGGLPVFCAFQHL